MEGVTMNNTPYEIVTNRKYSHVFATKEQAQRFYISVECDEEFTFCVDVYYNGERLDQDQINEIILK